MSARVITEPASDALSETGSQPPMATSFPDDFMALGRAPEVSCAAPSPLVTRGDLDGVSLLALTGSVGRSAAGSARGALVGQVR